MSVVTAIVIICLLDAAIIALAARWYWSRLQRDERIARRLRESVR